MFEYSLYSTLFNVMIVVFLKEDIRVTAIDRNDDSKSNFVETGFGKLFADDIPKNHRKDFSEMLVKVEHNDDSLPNRFQGYTSSDDFLNNVDYNGVKLPNTVFIPITQTQVRQTIPAYKEPAQINKWSTAYTQLLPEDVIPLSPVNEPSVLNRTNIIYDDEISNSSLESRHKSYHKQHSTDMKLEEAQKALEESLAVQNMLIYLLKKKSKSSLLDKSDDTQSKLRSTYYSSPSTVIESAPDSRLTQRHQRHHDYYDEASPSHHQVVHVLSKEEKKGGHGKYLWPIVGGGLTMLMGFLIISNILLSIPLLAIGASSLFNNQAGSLAGGSLQSQQLVPVYNLSQMIVTTRAPSGRRRRRRKRHIRFGSTSKRRAAANEYQMRELEARLERLFERMLRSGKWSISRLFGGVSGMSRGQVLKAAYCHRPMKIKQPLVLPQ